MIMKYSLLLFLLVSCGSSKNNCSNFKKGFFELYRENQLVNFIERDEEFQIDYTIDSLKSIDAISYINWKDDCNFELFEIKDKREDNNPVIIKINEIKNDTALINARVTISKAPIKNFKYKYIKINKKLSAKFFKIKDSIER